ncbi:MAG: hypothetical protein ACK4NF_03820 [Planctomycetota bacterium]
MQKIRIAKFFLHLSIILGILKLFATNGYAINILTKIQNIHGKLFIFGFFGTLITFEKVFNTAFKFIPIFFIAGALTEIVNSVIAIKYMHPCLKLIPSSLYLCGGFMFSIFSLKNYIYLKMQSYYFNFLAGLLLSISSILSKDMRTLLDFENVEYFILFPVFVILGERIELSRVFGNNIFTSIQPLFATITFVLYTITIFVPGIYKIEKLCLLLLILISFANDIKIQMTKLVKIPPIQRYFRTTLNISYIFAITGILLLIYRRFEPGFHSLSLGFIFGMVFSHSIIIFPSIFGKMPKEEKLSYLPFTIFTLGNIVRIVSSTIIYGGILPQKIIPFFSIINIASGFIHFISLILLFVMIKSMTR